MDKLLELCKSKNISVEFKDLGETYGYSTNGRIAINPKGTLNTQINTLLHEIAHELMHKGSNLSKEQKEIQAEAVAYAVSRCFGLEPKSFNYLALYDADEKRIMENMGEIAGCVREIMAGRR